MEIFWLPELSFAAHALGGFRVAVLTHLASSVVTLFFPSFPVHQNICCFVPVL